MPASKRKTSLGNLPAPLSSFVGREREIGEIRHLILSNRLITLTGPGGCGKTRLALRLGHELLRGFDDGIWFVELASVADAALVQQTIAATLPVREPSGRRLMDILIDHFSLHRGLLVLDNCEHLISACADIVDTLLQKCPPLKILATSREALGITGEVAWNVPPLSLPSKRPWTNPASVQDALRLYEESESVQLFVVRATANAPDFQLTSENGPWVAEICRQLDGIPLAIELAAARARSLSVQQIAQRLDDRFRLLTGGSRTAPPRQQTLASTLDWSYALLSAIEQKALQWLSVFAGGATLNAAEAVCASADVESIGVLDILSRLVDKSLILADKPTRGGTRYRLLETIRQYAHEKLVGSSQVDQAKDRHLNYFLQWTEYAEAHLKGPEQVEILDQYEAEHDNLRAALEWCTASPQRVDASLRLVVACARFWRLRGYLSEGRAHIDDVLRQVDDRNITEAHARALFWDASLAYLQSDYPATRLLGEKSLALWRTLNSADRSGLADILDLLGELATEEGDYQNAPALFEEALEIFRELEDPSGIADMLMQLAWAYMRMGRYDQVTPRMEEALALFRENEDAAHIGFTLSGLGELAIRQGEYERATHLLEESLAIRKQHGHKWGMGASLGSLGWVALRQGNLKRMKAIFKESIAIRVEIGDKGGLAWCLEKLAEAKYEESRFQDAAKIFGYAESLRAPLHSVIDPADQPEYGRLVSELRSVLGEETFAVDWAKGAAMPFEQILDLALFAPEALPTVPPTEKEKFAGLTTREREVAVLIAHGKSNREIAAVMTVGVKTVETYVTRILNKLGFNSRVQIATWAVETGLK